MEKRVYQNYVAILKGELVPAMGCTEPIAVAFAAARAKEVLGRMPEKIDMYCSGNIIKNVMGVTVPNSGERKGINIAAVIGALGGDSTLGMEVISRVTSEQADEAQRLVEQGLCKSHLVEGEENLYIRCEMSAGNDSSLVEIRTDHTHISRIDKNGETIFSQKDLENEEHGDKSLLNLKDIYEFANTLDIEDVREVLQRQIDYNTAISNEGLTNKWGAQVGKTLLSRCENPDFVIRARAVAAAGSDARMSGCAMPVVVNSGSGNQGMTVCLPIVEYAKQNQCSEEKLFRALALANLISMLQKKYIGNLSAYCGATCAGCAAACGVAYLDGASFDIIGHTIINGIANIGGMVCDGAKPSCAAKIASAVEAGLLGYELAKENRNFKPGEGMIVDDIEGSIKNWGRMGAVGMRGTDIEILNIMLGN